MSAPKVLKITREDGSLHTAPLTAKASLQHQNNLRPAHLKWQIEVIDAEEAAELPWKDKNFVPAGAQAIVTEKQNEIDALKAQLAALQAGNSGNAPTGEQGAGSPVGAKSKDGNANDAIAKIETLLTVAEVEEFVAGDQRVTVIKAAQARTEALKA